MLDQIFNECVISTKWLALDVTLTVQFKYEYVKHIIVLFISLI